MVKEGIMIYQGQTCIITTLKNKDIVALGQAIDSLNKEIVYVSYSVVQIEPCVVEYSAVVITKE